MKLILSESLFHNNNGKDYEVLLKNKKGDALVKDVNRNEWVCAYRLGEKEWAQGHYFDTYEDAKVYWDIHYADYDDDDTLTESTRYKADEVIVDIKEDGFIEKMHELRDKGYESDWAGNGMIGFVKWIDADDELKESAEELKDYHVIAADGIEHSVAGTRERAEKVAQKYRDRGAKDVSIRGKEDIGSTDIDDVLADLRGIQKEEKLSEDIVKKPNGKWTNRGDDGKEHGEFKTKKAAAAQARAMFANGHKHESLEESGDQVYEYTDRFTVAAHEDDSYDSPVASVDSNDIQKIIDFAWHMIRAGYYIFAIEHPSGDIECIAPEEILNSGDAREKLERRLMSIVHHNFD